MDLNLSGRVALVTGASKGVGLAITRTLLEEGMRVVAASRGRTPELDALEGPLLHVSVDLQDARGPAEAVARTIEHFGRLDVLVNNVGGPPAGTALPHDGFLGRTDADWLAILELNLLSAVRTTRCAIPVLLEGGGGAIVNVSSAAARQPSPMNVDYAAAKAALTCLTKGLSEEFGPQGIRVNTVSPGPVLTPWWTDPGGAADVIGTMAGADAAEVVGTLAPEMMSLTTGRFAEPTEVAAVVALLASPRSASTTGSDVVVDSGMLKAL